MKMTPFLVRNLVIVSFLATSLGEVLATGERFLLHRTSLDGEGKFQMSWGPGDLDDLVFKIEVMTLGYVALGLSPNGGMAGSDIVTGWVRDGAVYFQDRYAEGRLMPRRDKSQDWVLLSGSENDTHTTLLFRRKLETCDEDDMTIDSSTMRVIYAYFDEDPTDEDSIPYHHLNRGSKSILLLQPEMKRTTNLEGTSHWDVLSPNYTLTSDTPSIYWCKIMKGPELTQKHHVIMVEPMVEKGHEGYVHHLVLYQCAGSEPEMFEEHLSTAGHECHHPNMPEAFTKCDGVYAAWGVGGASLVFPEHVGMPLDPSPPKYYLLEVHYDNPFRHGGIHDNSGYRLYYTSKLRQHDAGTLMLGVAVSSLVVVPPDQKEYVVAGHTNPECLGPVMQPEGIKIIGVFQHAHLLGRRIKTRHFRGETELPPLASDSNYDFNYQEYHYFTEEKEFLPGDQITVECTYDSTGRATTTFGGLSTSDEMCLSFVLYYPKIERYASMSVAPKDTVVRLIGGEELVSLVFNDPKQFHRNYLTYVAKFDWSKTNMESLEEGLRYVDHKTLCYLGNGEKFSVRSLISYPKDLVEYIVPPSCVEEGNSNNHLTAFGHNKAVTAIREANFLYSLLALYLLYFLL